MKTNVTETGGRTNLYGLVVCGGQSTRMNSDKSLLVYHGQTQRQHIHDMLLPFCEQVFFSFNADQTANTPENSQVITDDVRFQNTGPIAGILTAFARYPENNFIVLGCDYPLLTSSTIESFLESIDDQQIAAAFYNENNYYEPLLAWYSHRSSALLETSFNSKEYSLQHFLKSHNATRYRPENPTVMQSVDTFDAYLATKQMLDNLKKRHK